MVDGHPSQPTLGAHEYGCRPADAPEGQIDFQGVLATLSLHRVIVAAKMLEGERERLRGIGPRAQRMKPDRVSNSG
jgi:hypothetical protein